MIESWLAPDPNPFTVAPFLLRKDCVEITDKGQCNNQCVWREEGEPRCRIHTPAQIQVSSKAGHTTPAGRFFALHLIDELLRLPARRQEMIDNRVKRMQVPTTNIQVGTQWVVPQNVPAWYELLNPMRESKLEIPMYWEEMSRSPDTNQNIAEATAVAEVKL